MNARMRWRLSLRKLARAMRQSGAILWLILVSTLSLEGCGMGGPSLESLRAAAEQGDATAQNNLGLLYHRGQGVAQDFEVAIRWYRIAAEQGRAGAQHNLGVAYRDGEGVVQNHEEAVQWFLMAAEQGVAGAQSNLGVAYHQGQGIAQDFEEAVQWYRMAAEQGDAQAQSNLGLLYHQGQGVAQDFEEAVRWYRMAAEKGHTEAQFNLGVMYANGEVPFHHFSFEHLQHHYTFFTFLFPFNVIVPCEIHCGRGTVKHQRTFVKSFIHVSRQ